MKKPIQILSEVEMFCKKKHLNIEEREFGYGLSKNKWKWVLRYINGLEKALDNACLTLEKITIDCSECGECELRRIKGEKVCECCQRGEKELWKEYFLEESERQ